MGLAYIKWNLYVENQAMLVTHVSKNHMGTHKAYPLIFLSHGP